METTKEDIEGFLRHFTDRELAERAINRMLDDWLYGKDDPLRIAAKEFIENREWKK